MKKQFVLISVICSISLGFASLSFIMEYKDQDGHVFKSVIIGENEWMAENLNVVTFRNGDSIFYAKTNEDWQKANVNKLAAYGILNNDPANCAKKGKLYNWYAVSDPRILAPKGWHTPSDNEWIKLSTDLGMSDEEAAKLHERGTDQGTRLKDPTDKEWNLPDSLTIQYTGFNAKSGSCRLHNGDFWNETAVAVFWSTTETSTGGAYAYGIHPAPFFNRCDDYKGFGMSVRCVKDKD